MKRMPRVAALLASTSLIVAGLVALPASPALAWGGPAYFSFYPARDCQLYGQSTNNTRKEAQTVYNNGDECGQMGVAFKIGTSGTSPYSNGPLNAYRSTTSTSYNGAWHRPCIGCSARST